MREKNIYISICFWAFSSSWKEEKKKICSKSAAETVVLLPNYLVKKKNLYCNLAIVLQERGLKKKKNCIAIQLLYCRLGGLAGLYCSMGKNCIAGCCIVLQYRECNG